MIDYQIDCIDADASGTCNGSETLWQYDAYGNLLSDGTTTYTFDAANRVSSIAANSVTTTYVYNGDGDRISQTVGSVTTTYVLDTATPLTMVLAETTGETTILYWHALDTLAQSDGTTTQYFAYDGLGSVRQLVDATGSVGLAQTFDPYGNGYSKAGSAQSTLGYTGEQTDSNGFVFLRARYYQPGMGRFTQMDPSRQESNPYLYSAGNPVMSVDPTGRLAYQILSSPCSANPPVPTPKPYPITGITPVTPTHAFIPGADDEGRVSGIHPSDVSQAWLGDCYFAAGLAEIAYQKPELIGNSIVEHGGDQYTVSLHGYAPVDLQPYKLVSDNNQRYYLKLGDTDGVHFEVWPLILENAWARVHLSDPTNGDLIQGYEAIGRGGSVSKVFELFTNTKSQFIESKSDEFNLANLDQLFNQQKALVALTTYFNGEQKYPDAYGSGDDKIHSNHTYYLTEVNMTNGTFTIRNPWGWNFSPKRLPSSALKAFHGAWVNAGQ